MTEADDARALHQAWRGWLAEVDRIRSEAVAAERNRITEAVRELFGQLHPMCAIEDEPTDHKVVSRKAVLTIIGGVQP